MVEPGSSPQEGRQPADEAAPVDPADHVSAGGSELPDTVQPSPALPADISEEILDALPAPPLGDVEELAKFPSVIRVARPPHPSFWWAVLWCGLFLIVTQVIPAIVISVFLLIPELLQSPGRLTDMSAPATAPGTKQGTDKPGRSDEAEKAAEKAAQERIESLQRRIVLPALIASQVLGIVFSCLALRMVAGPSWRRQVALRLPGVTHVVLALVGFPALPILASGAYGLAKLALPGLAQILPLLGTEVFVLGALWLYLRLAGGPHWNRTLARKPPVEQFGFVFAGVLGVLLASVGVYGVYLRVTQVLPINLTLPLGGDLMEKMVEQFRDWPWALGVLVIGLGPGLSEELWCRGFLGRGLLGQYGVVMGVLLTSFLFGLIHGDPHQGTMAMLMGLVLHFAYLMTRSLLIPMLLHFLNNALSVLAQHFGEMLEKIDTNPEEISPRLYLASAVLLLVVGWALVRSRARLVAVDPSGPPAWRPAFPSVALPPTGTNTAVVHPLLSWQGWLLVTLAAAGFGCAFRFT